MNSRDDQLRKKAVWAVIEGRAAHLGKLRMEFEAAGSDVAKQKLVLGRIYQLGWRDAVILTEPAEPIWEDFSPLSYEHLDGPHAEPTPEMLRRLREAGQ